MKSEAIKTIRQKMLEAIQAIDDMQKSEDFFGGMTDNKSKKIVKQCKENAAEKIADVGSTLEDLHEKLETVFSN